MDEDFSFTRCVNDIPQTFTIGSVQIVELPKWLADQGAKDLANYWVWKRGIKTNYEDEMKSALKEIYVQI